MIKSNRNLFNVKNSYHNKENFNKILSWVLFKTDKILKRTYHISGDYYTWQKVERGKTRKGNKEPDEMEGRKKNLLILK